LAFALAAMAMLAVGFGSGVFAVWLVLAPILPVGAAGEQLREPFPSRVGSTALDGRGAEPTAVVTNQPSVTPPMPEHQPLTSHGTGDETGVVVDQRDDGMPEMIAPVVAHVHQRLRCAHNAASVR
jgi:hypothetical protein